MIAFNLLIPIAFQIFLALIKNFLAPHIFSMILGLILWFVVPLSLVLYNFYLLNFQNNTSLTKCSVFMLFGFLAGLVIGYIFWGLVNKKLFTPDGETIDIIKEISLFYMTITICFFILMHLLKFFSKK